MQINLQVQWPLMRINILDVLKPTEEEIAKYYKRLSLNGTNGDEGSSDHNSPLQFNFKSEASRFEDFDVDREEMSNSLKRNQKPSEFNLKLFVFFLLMMFL